MGYLLFSDRYRKRAVAFLMLGLWANGAMAQRDAMSARAFPSAAQPPSSGIAKSKSGSSASTVNFPKSSDTVRFDLSKDLAEQLVPFEEVYQIALMHSPALRYENAMVDIKNSIANYTKIAILQNIGGLVTYSRGNQLTIGSGTSNFDFAQTSNGYGIGMRLQLPLSEVVGRRYKLQQTRSDYQASLAQREVAKLGLKRELNRVYQGLLTSQRTLRIRLRDEQAMLMAFRIAEVDMQQGKISPADYARYSNQYASGQIGSEQQRGDFMLSFRDLEILVGVPMIQLQISR